MGGLFYACVGLSATANATDTGGAIDSREVYGPAAPTWLHAVGKLQVPGSIYREGLRNHLLENCSATLVTTSPDEKADTLITAWHCLANYNDLSKPIIFTLAAGVQGVLQREAYRLADGGGMHADWAILRLQVPVDPAESSALLVHPDRAEQGRVISMAGYSRDKGKGGSGERLTFDPACRITTRSADSSASNCLAHKGASGGAVVQLSAAGTAQLCGVVSEGDSAGLSTFVPVAAFRSAIKRHLH